MKIEQIRNATLIVAYANKRFLIDPFLAAKGSYLPFPNSVRQDQNNPLVELPKPIEEIIDVDAVIVTHLHLDHWDDTAKEALPKTIKMFVQNDEDGQILKAAGFTNVEVLTEQTTWEDIELIKTEGEHGRGEILKFSGSVCGIVFKHESEKTLYIAGDTVWYEGVEKTLRTFNPEIIVVNAGDNQFLEGGSLVMGIADVYEVHKAAPHAIIIASHMEAVNHWTLSREELRNFISDKGISRNVLVPNDGDGFSF
ncbi:MBL fold metallo-hydrolase [Lysinibacillus sp. 3P01SB]|uniref:MBL fold metallo-hydrolase n=1 Tax=Lysinibacillus sp. 3P01SB TaxID=3132284 RepID=UPI0039A733E3